MPQTVEVVIYQDGTSAVTTYDRAPDTGRLTYIGRTFLDAAHTAAVLALLWPTMHPPGENRP